MLDLKTIVITLVCTTAIQALIWLSVWIAWRRIVDVKCLALGFALVALGMFLMALRGPAPSQLHIMVDISTVKMGTLFLAVGLLRFLGQPVPAWFAPVVFAAHTILFGGALVLNPDDNFWRIHISTAFTVIVQGYMALTLARDREHPAALRWITILVLCEYIGASLLQSALTVTAPLAAFDQPAAVLDNRNAWYFLQAEIFLIGLFTSFMFMVGSRLSIDLKRKNDALETEIALRRRLEADLAASLEEQRQLLRVVNHEFRTPLALVQRSSEMAGVLLQPVPPRVAERLSAIEDAVRRLFVVLDRFLSADRLDTGGMKLRPVDVAALLAEVGAHFEAMGARDRLKMDIAPSLPAIAGDADMLTSVMVNLVDNALKYSPPDATVEVRAESRDGALRLSVRDRGVGIPEEERDRVGQRFFRASNTGSTSGTGLGLYNSKRFVACHGGGLSLETPEEGGLLAVIRLPLERPAAAETGQ